MLALPPELLERIVEEATIDHIFNTGLLRHKPLLGIPVLLVAQARVHLVDGRDAGSEGVAAGAVAVVGLRTAGVEREAGGSGGDTRILEAGESAATAGIRLLLSTHTATAGRLDIRTKLCLYLSARLRSQVSKPG